MIEAARTNKQVLAWGEAARRPSEPVGRVKSFPRSRVPVPRVFCFAARYYNRGLTK